MSFLLAFALDNAGFRILRFGGACRASNTPQNSKSIEKRTWRGAAKDVGAANDDSGVRPEPKTELRLSAFGWLKTLKASTTKSSLRRSPKGKYLSTRRSKLMKRGVRKAFRAKPSGRDASGKARLCSSSAPVTVLTGRPLLNVTIGAISI